MVANPNSGGNVYNRDSPEDLHQAWNAVIRKVNEERANPPEGTNCDELDSIDEVEVDHIWTTKDIEDLRDAIDEMCEFAWVENLEFWHDDILTEIDDALDREYGGWGDEGECCHEECIPDCDNAADEVVTYVGSFLLTECWPNHPESPSCTPEEVQAAEEAGGRCSAAIVAWIGFWKEYCVLVGEVEDLENELEILQDYLVVLEEARDIECAKPPPNRCAQAQQAVDDKQQEVDDKQDELVAKEAERDSKKAEADAVEATADSEATSSMALADVATPVGCQFYFTSLPSIEPWTNIACDELGPDCFGKDPARCRVWWRVDYRPHTYYCWGGEYQYPWMWRMSGGYTMSGQPYVTGIHLCAGVGFYICAPVLGCENPRSCGTGCNEYQEQEVRMVQTYPKVWPGGEHCCDD